MRFADLIPEKFRLRIVGWLRRLIWRLEGGRDLSVYEKWNKR